MSNLNIERQPSFTLQGLSHCRVLAWEADTPYGIELQANIYAAKAELRRRNSAARKRTQERHAQRKVKYTGRLA